MLVESRKLNRSGVTLINTREGNTVVSSVNDARMNEANDMVGKGFIFRISIG